MKLRPILFSVSMVRAILDGSKTQTRRAVNDRFIAFIGGAGDDQDDPRNWGFGDENGNWHVLGQNEKTFYGDSGSHGTYRITCPHGDPGDRLYVAETHFAFGHWEPIEGVKTKGGRQKWRFVRDSKEVLFDAPESFRTSRNKSDSATPAWHKRLGRFMFRADARITLEIVSVKVELLNAISERDACADGGFSPITRDCKVPKFRELWESIHGEGAWEKNPWVWVVEFRRCS